MSTIAPPRRHPRHTGADTVERFDKLLEVTDFATAFWIVRKTYRALQLTFQRHDRPDLLAQLADWHAEDVERTRRAQGKVWI